MRDAGGKPSANDPRVERDQSESAFAPILSELVRRVPGARAAALVDFDGETVDYASSSDPYAVRLAAAHWRIVLHEVHAQASMASTRAIAICASRRSFALYVLPEGYTLAMVLSCGAGLDRGRRALAMCLRLLAREAGWPPPELPPWYPAIVQCDDRQRPASIQGGDWPYPLEILGSLAGGLARYERGWRVRSGLREATLVREPGGFWYVDETPHTGAGASPPAGPESR